MGVEEIHDLVNGGGSRLVGVNHVEDGLNLGLWHLETSGNLVNRELDISVLVAVVNQMLDFLSGWHTLGLGESVGGSHGSGKLVLINLSVSVSVDVIKVSINGIVSLLVLLGVRDVGIDASVNLVFAESARFISVAMINDFSWGDTKLGKSLVSLHGS